MSEGDNLHLKAALARPRSVAIIGAGFSYAATKGACPLTTRFLERVNRHQYPSLYRFMFSLPEHMRYNLAYVVEDIDTCDEMPAGSMRSCAMPSGVKPENVRRELQWYSIKLLSPLKASPCGSWPLGWLCDQVLCKGSTLITTNYDSLIEETMRYMPQLRHRKGGDCPQCKMKELLRAGCPCPQNAVPQDYWRGSLLKLHGSVCWSLCRRPDCCATGCISYQCVHKPHSLTTKCELCGGPTEPVIVLPRLRGKYVAYPKIDAMWESAALALKEAEVLHVFGFSFSDVDKELCKFLQVCFTARTLKQVRIIDLEPEVVALKLKSLLPDGYQLEILGMRPPRSFAAPSPGCWVPVDGSPLAQVST